MGEGVIPVLVMGTQSLPGEHPSPGRGHTPVMAGGYPPGKDQDRGMLPEVTWDQILGYSPRKDLGLESWEGTVDLTGIPPPPGVKRLKT